MKFPTEEKGVSETRRPGGSNCPPPFTGTG